jgi:hypothetical protein
LANSIRKAAQTSHHFRGVFHDKGDTDEIVSRLCQYTPLSTINIILQFHFLPSECNGISRSRETMIVLLALRMQHFL